MSGDRLRNVKQMRTMKINFLSVVKNVYCCLAAFCFAFILFGGRLELKTPFDLTSLHLSDDAGITRGHNETINGPVKTTVYWEFHNYAESGAIHGIQSIGIFLVAIGVPLLIYVIPVFNGVMIVFLGIKWIKKRILVNIEAEVTSQGDILEKRLLYAIAIGALFGFVLNFFWGNAVIQAKVLLPTQGICNKVLQLFWFIGIPGTIFFVVRFLCQPGNIKKGGLLESTLGLGVFVLMILGFLCLPIFALGVLCLIIGFDTDPKYLFLWIGGPVAVPVMCIYTYGKLRKLLRIGK